jgi:hypothetical protein
VEGGRDFEGVVGTDQGEEVSEPDSLVGVRDCGCITAWMDIEHSTKKEVREFYAEMATTGREVRRVSLDDIRDRIGRCEHGGVGERVAR